MIVEARTAGTGVFAFFNLLLANDNPAKRREGVAKKEWIKVAVITDTPAAPAVLVPLRKRSEKKRKDMLET